MFQKKENGENTSTSKNSSLGIGWEWPLPNVVGDSVQEASKLFEFLIQPVTPAKFFKWVQWMDEMFRCFGIMNAATCHVKGI